MGKQLWAFGSAGNWQKGHHPSGTESGTPARSQEQLEQRMDTSLLALRSLLLSCTVPDPSARECAATMGWVFLYQFSSQDSGAQTCPQATFTLPC